MAKRKVSDKTARLLRKVKKTILSRPNQYRQDQWHCGTAMCIGGHIVMQAIPDVQAMAEGDDYWPSIHGCRLEEGWEELALRILGVDPFDYTSLFAQFPEDEWPEPFCSDWDKAVSRKDRAEVAARRIDHFIATGE